MKPLLMIAIVLGACAGGQRPETPANPTCNDVIEHGYQMHTGELRGEHAIVARREFTRIKPRLLEMCESASLSIELKRCIVGAEDSAAAEACEQRFR